MARQTAFTLGTKISRAGIHTTITLWHRLLMFPGPWGVPNELNLMVQEKIAAVVDGALDARTEAFRLLTAAALGKLDFLDMPHAPVAVIEAGLRPAFRTVKANSRRLSRAISQETVPACSIPLSPLAPAHVENSS